MLVEEAKKIQLQRLWCQHCKALQKTNDTVVECWYNPLDHGREKAFCVANVDAIEEICQTFNQWLEEQGANHRVKCPHCSWSQVYDEVVGMSPCNKCNSTGYIFKSLRLETE